MNDKGKQPLIIGFISDLMFSSRLGDVALQLGFTVIWIEHSNQITDLNPDFFTRQYAEHMVGPGAILLEKISAWSPSLIVFDLNNLDIPWRDWVALIKSVPATRRIPVICFGSHMDVQTMQAAQEAGANAVFARSRFVKELPTIIQKYARLIDYTALEATCQIPLSAKALHGLELFNQSEYFEAHEILEEAWNEDDSPGRELYRAILQVAVAYLQIQRGNYNGALKMFLRMRQWIDPLPDVCRGVDVERLRQDSFTVYKHLVDLGGQRIIEFDKRLLKTVKFKK